MRCEHCKNKVIQVSPDGGQRVRIDGPLEVDASGTVFGRCYWCKNRIELPLVSKSSEPKRIRLFITNNP